MIKILYKSGDYNNRREEDNISYCQRVMDGRITSTGRRTVKKINHPCGRVAWYVILAPIEYRDMIVFTVNRYR